MRLSEAPDKTPPPRKEREHGRPMRYGNAVLRGSCYCRNGDRLLRSQSKFRLSSFSSATSTQQSIGSLNAATRFPSRCGRRQSWSWRAARQERPASEDLESHAKQMQLPRDETAISFLISSSPFSLAGTWDGPGRAGPGSIDSPSLCLERPGRACFIKLGSPLWPGRTGFGLTFEGGSFEKILLFV